jgi:hypothetical protein
MSSPAPALTTSVSGAFVRQRQLIRNRHRWQLSRHRKRLANLVRLCPAIGAAALCLGGNAYAATYYVATNGNDTFNGSSANPWATLQHAVETIAPGDTILVRSGTYAGCRIRNSGTSTAPKTLARDACATVVINTPGPQNSHSILIEIENVSGPTSRTGSWTAEARTHPTTASTSGSPTAHIRNCYARPAASASGDGIFPASPTRCREQRGGVQHRARHLRQQQRGLPTIRATTPTTTRGASSSTPTTVEVPLRHHRAGRDHLVRSSRTTCLQQRVNGGSALNMDGGRQRLRNNLLYNNHA